MKLKIRARMGFGPGEDRHIAVLNRLLSLDVLDGRQVLRIELDPRHAALIVGQAGLDGDRAEGVTTPGEKGGDYYNIEPLTEDSKTFDRSLCARLGYLAQELPMIRHCFTRSAAFMAKPRIESWNKLRRVARFMKQHRRRTREFIGQEDCILLKVSADSDWA